MKTVKIFLATLMLSVAFFSCQKTNIEPRSATSNEVSLKAGSPNSAGTETPEENSTKIVVYVVNVNFQLDKPLCDLYYVEILDANGQMVAPKQSYIPGTKTYYFKEQIRQRSGIRVAHLILSPNPTFTCETRLYTSPAPKRIEFKNMEKYLFDLYPQTHPHDVMD